MPTRLSHDHRAFSNVSSRNPIAIREKFTRNVVSHLFSVPAQPPDGLLSVEGVRLRRSPFLFQRVANQALTVSPQPAVTVEGPVSKMSPPTNDVTNGVVAPPNTMAPRVSPTANPALTTINPPTHKRTPKDFIFGKVIGEGSFSTVSVLLRKLN